MRLAHAVQEMHSGATLTEISYRNGFVNETAMIRAFRKYRGMTPSEYRKQMKHTAEQSEKKGKEREETAEDHDIFQNLLQYAAVTEQGIETTNESAVSVTAAVNGRKPRVAGHWKRVINAGYAASVLNREVQDELEQLVQELGYELIRVKGILDDDMCVLRRNMWGEIQFCWNYIDEVIDFILSTGAKPLLEFGHMPLLLAKTDPGRTMRPALSSSPRDLAEWRMLIKNLMEHLRERYGINQMRRWIFNPWISGDVITIDGGDEFFGTWKASYEEMKRVSPDLVTCLSFGLGPEEHLKAFIETMKEKECVPEIFAFRSFGTVIYGEEEEKMNLIQNNESVNMIVSRDPDFLRNRGEKVKGLLQKLGLVHCRFWWMSAAATSGRGICATIPVIKRHGCLKIFWKMKRRCRELRISRSMTVWMKYFRRGNVSWRFWAVHDERHSKGGLHCAAAARQNGISSGEAWGRLFYQHGAGEKPKPDLPVQLCSLRYAVPLPPCREYFPHGPLPRIQYGGNPDLFSEADRTGTGKILPAAV